MSITITENAARQIAKQLEKRGCGLGLRLGVKTAGCSGFAYVIDYADDIAVTDNVYEAHGAKIIVATTDLGYLEGIEVDYTREGVGEAFRFNNPKAAATCGCGESFTIG